MLHLTRLRLDPRSAQVRAELRNPYEMHRTLSKAVASPALPGEVAKAALEDARVLFRREGAQLDGSEVVLVQTRTPPMWTGLTVEPRYFAAPPETKCFAPAFRTGQRLGFRLRANPTLKRNSKRYGLYEEHEQIAWLQRKAKEGGFAVETALPIIEQRSLRAPRKGSMMEFLAVRYDGLLRVTDPHRFPETLASGLGSGKAFGFGLLSVAPPRA